MSLALLIVGVVILVGEVYCRDVNEQVEREGLASAAWLRAYRRRRLIGLPFALAFVACTYLIDHGAESARVFGFPFQAFGFDAVGRGYFSVLTPFYVLGNFFIGLWLPEIALRVGLHTTRLNTP